MSGERNRRSLAFRGGGLAGLTGSSGISGANCNSWEAPACQDRQFNGNRPDQEEDRDLGVNGSSPKRVEGAGSVSHSTEPEAEEEEDPEGGSWAAGDGDDRVGSVEAEDGSREANSLTAGDSPENNNTDGQESGSGETGSRKSGVEMRPQTLLQKHSLFHASWLQEFPWLKFCQETGLMSCSWCHNIATKNSDELVKGSRNYKRALLLRHHLSSEHGRNDPTKQVTLARVHYGFTRHLRTIKYLSHVLPQRTSVCVFVLSLMLQVFRTFLKKNTHNEGESRPSPKLHNPFSSGSLAASLAD